MQTIIYLIRHSKRMWNWTEDAVLKSDDPITPLSTEGDMLAIKLAERKEFKDVQCIYSSPYIRTIETIKHIVEKYNIKVVLDNNLKERVFGKTIDNWEEFNRMQWDDCDYKGEGGESLNEVEKRMSDTINQYIREHAGQTIIVSSHGTASACLLKHYDENYNYDKRMEMKSPDMWRLVFDSERLIKVENICLE